MSWSSQTERATDNYQIQEKWHEKVFRPRGTSAPAYLDGENSERYRRRMMQKATPFVAADLQSVKIDDLYGSALDHYELKYFESAAAEAVKPTNIPDGTLKEVVNYDATGRPSYSYFGSPRVWMEQFGQPKKRLVGIRTVTEHGYRPGNLGPGNLG